MFKNNNIGYRSLRYVRRVISLVRQKLPAVLIILLVLSVSTVALVPQLAHAAPEDYKTKEDCESSSFQWDEKTNTCVQANGSENSCNIDGLGWIICPAVILLANIADTAFDFLSSNFLEINSNYVTAPTVTQAWSIMRTLANIVFVVGFMAIIYSQLSGVGISNYGVKRMLPRLVIAAILVNLSLIICQIVVDVSNIAGYSINTLFKSISDNTLPPGGGDSNPILNVAGWAVYIPVLLAGGITLASSISIPVLLMSVLAILMVAFILVVRIALIITLTIVSPLAFVAYLLPNTERLFKKWYKMLFSLLMVFPVIGVLYGASSLVSKIILFIATDPNTAGNPNLLLAGVGLGAASVPLVFTKSLLDGAVQATGTLGAKLQGVSKGLQSKSGAMAKSKLDRSHIGDTKRALSSALARGSARMRSRTSKYDNSRIGRFLGWDRGAAAAASAVDKSIQEDIDYARNQVKDIDIAGWSDEQLASNFYNSSTAQQTAIIERAIATGDPAKYQSLVDKIGSDTSSDRRIVALRQATARALAENGPKALVSAHLDAISRGAMQDVDDDGNHKYPSSLSDMVRAGVSSGALTQEKMVQESSSNLRFAQSVADRSGQERLNETANNLLNNADLVGKIKHNRGVINEMAGRPADTPITQPQPQVQAQPAQQSKVQVQQPQTSSQQKDPPARRSSFDQNRERDPNGPASTFSGGEEATASGLIIPRNRR